MQLLYRHENALIIIALFNIKGFKKKYVKLSDNAGHQTAL
jgi:hypothetical protein